MVGIIAIPEPRWNRHDALVLVVGERYKNVDSTRRVILGPGKHADRSAAQRRGKSPN